MIGLRLASTHVFPARLRLGRTAVLLLLAALSFLLFALAALPLRFVLAQSAALPRAVTESAEGTPWQGRLSFPLGAGGALHRLILTGSAGALWRGQYRAAWQLSGAVAYGRGHLRSGFSGGLELRDSALDLDISQVTLPTPVPLAGQVSVAASRVMLAPNGYCLVAEGQASSDILQRAEALTGWRGPLLEGNLRCQDGWVAALLQGQTPAGDAVSLDLWLTAGQYYWELSLNPATLAGVAVTATLEMQSEGERYVRRQTGRYGNP